jgi:hypothetical protein
MVATLRYFMRHHARADAVVLSADQRWCSRDPAMQVLLAFPFSLYRSGTRAALELHLFSVLKLTTCLTLYFQFPDLRFSLSVAKGNRIQVGRSEVSGSAESRWLFAPQENR